MMESSADQCSTAKKYLGFKDTEKYIKEWGGQYAFSAITFEHSSNKDV